MFKKFVILFIAVSSSFVLLNSIVFFFWRVPSVNVGDLARLGHLNNEYAGYQEQVKTESPLKKYYGIIFKDVVDDPSLKIDCITIGDSFSQQGVYGYQNFMAEKGIRVLNIPRFKSTGQIQTLQLLLENGFINEHDVKFVVLEFVERGLETLSNKAVLSPLANPLAMDEVVHYYSNNEDKRHKSVKPGFINKGNYLFLARKIKKEKDHIFMTKVFITDIKEPLFSHREKDLLFYEDDFLNKKIGTTSVEKAVKNLDCLNKRLAEHGVKLIFMTAVNKYNLYFEYIKDKQTYTDSDSFEKMRKQPRSFIFCDTKKILLDKLHKKEKDIYYADDTHWSWKAAQYVADDLCKIMHDIKGDLH